MSFENPSRRADGPSEFSDGPAGVARPFADTANRIHRSIHPGPGMEPYGFPQPEAVAEGIGPTGVFLFGGGHPIAETALLHRNVHSFACFRGRAASPFAAVRLPSAWKALHFPSFRNHFARRAGECPPCTRPLSCQPFPPRTRRSASLPVESAPGGSRFRATLRLGSGPPTGHETGSTTSRRPSTIRTRRARSSRSTRSAISPGPRNTPTSAAGSARTSVPGFPARRSPAGSWWTPPRDRS